MSSPDEIPLQCLDGSSAPPELGEALRRLNELPPAARAARAELLLQLLEPLPDDQLDARIGRLCRRLELPPEVAGPGFKAARVVLRAAAAMNMDREALAADLAALGSAGADDLLDVYDQAFANLRGEVIQATIAAHGRVLIGLEWRVDTLGASNRGRKLNVPVALMTFHLQHGTHTEHVTMQLVPQMVEQLRDVCNRLLK